MKPTFVTLAALAVFAVAAEAKRKNWVLLVAGSKGYCNYRHQADVCHAYQIFHKAGIPDEQIVVMMYDDIAYNEKNPYKGNIINRPDGPNVYPGVLKDYTGDNVTTEVFLAVLQGDKEGVRNLLGREGKVIDSTPDDYIFVYYADHGGKHVLNMPNGPDLMDRDLNAALKNMHKNNRFAKLVFYVSACHSGSMFEDLLPTDINVYAVTATNPDENGYPCYLDLTRFTFLGDFFSANWMEDTERADLHKETFHQQYQRVKKETILSHVMQYGDTSIAKLTLDQFFCNNASQQYTPESYSSPSIRDAIPSEMVRVQILKNKMKKYPAKSIEGIKWQKELDLLNEEMEQINRFFNNIARTVYSKLSDKQVYDLAMRERKKSKNLACYETALHTLLTFCPGLDIGVNDFALRKLYVLVNLCNDQPQEKVVYAVESISSSSPLCLA